MTSMAIVLQHKVVASLPSPLEPDSIYYVRVGQGFDIYVTNGSGVVVDYKLNAQVEIDNLPEWSTAETADEALTALGMSASGKTVATGTPADGRTALELGDAALADVVGDMSAGAIIERGSNANGEYVRFADGTQICSLYSPSVSVSSTARTEGGISFFYVEYMWSFPANFAAPPFTELTARIERAPSGVALFAPITVSTVTGVSSDFRISGPQEIVSLLYMSAIAIGRWK